MSLRWQCECTRLGSVKAFLEHSRIGGILTAIATQTATYPRMLYASVS